jgi:DNA modification methylase
MAGIGTTLVEAMLLGMNAVGVEYEKRFVKQANENIEHLQKLFGDKSLGRAVCIQGDARDLSFLDEKFGCIFFSPPYFDALSVNKGGGSKTSILYEETTQDLQMKRSGPFAVKKNLPTPYSSSKRNIGNLKDRSSYLEEMLKVYRECYRVLKPGKFMVVVVKDIQRNWKTIPLGADTIKLCQLAGFDCHDVIINKMYFPSFWMLNLAKKVSSRSIPFASICFSSPLDFTSTSKPAPRGTLKIWLPNDFSRAITISLALTSAFTIIQHQ